jgi:hypothetical protein
MTTVCASGVTRCHSRASFDDHVKARFEQMRHHHGDQLDTPLVGITLSRNADNQQGSVLFM